MTRLIRAELLKLRKRRGLMTWSSVIMLGSVAVIYGVRGLRHASDPLHVDPAGGLHSFQNGSFFLSQMVAVASIMLGTTAGAGDRAAGVFRDLVSTGVRRGGGSLSRASRRCS